MEHRFLARCLLTFLSAVQGAATLAIDLNRTHATHPRWLGHARFHLVWQAVTTALLAVLTLWVLWGARLPAEASFYLAVSLSCVPLFGFMLALGARTLYGGTLSDAGGIPPARLRVGRRVIVLDGNLAAVVGALVAIAGIVAIFRL